MPPPFDDQRVLSALRDLLNAIPVETIDPTSIKSRRSKLRQEIERAIERLQSLLTALDPVRMPEYVLDPSDPAIVGRLIADTLLEQPRLALDRVPPFYGSGVYALYYTGPFAAYQPIKGKNTPIYVGKANPANHGALNPPQQGDRLWRRLNDHRKSITEAQNLDLSNFECRYLVVKSAWQGTAETYLIERFKPIWNSEVGICYGFGKHGDNPETRSNKRSPWDTLHPGRPFALKTGNQPHDLTADQIEERIARHFRMNPPKE